MKSLLLLFLSVTHLYAADPFICEYYAENQIICDGLIYNSDTIVGELQHSCETGEPISDEMLRVLQRENAVAYESGSFECVDENEGMIECLGTYYFPSNHNNIDEPCPRTLHHEARLISELVEQLIIESIIEDVQNNMRSVGE